MRRNLDANTYSSLFESGILRRLAPLDENPDSLCEAKRELGFRMNAGASPNSAPRLRLRLRL
jgi:hypothetical protein